MVEPCENTGAPDTDPSEDSVVDSYQWKTEQGQKCGVWGRFQGWRQLRASRTKNSEGSQKKQKSFFRSKRDSNEHSRILARYLPSISLGRKKEPCQQPEKIEESPDPSIKQSIPEVPVWDVSNFDLIDGRLLLTKGEEQDAFCSRSRTGSCVSSTGGAQTGHSEGDVVSDGNLDTDTKNQFNNVKGLISKRKKRKNKKKMSTSSLQDDRSVHGSRESLSAVEFLDFTNEKDVTIRALHSSILGKQYCFEVITPNGIRCFGCSSVQERDRWIENLRRIVQPDMDNCEREECSLSLWIHEAKGLPNSGPGSRSRYFCEVHLDDALYGRTSGKTSESGAVFWSESFNLRDLPSSLGHVAIHLLREGKEAMGVGTVTLGLEGMKDGAERWVSLGGEMTLRLRGKYRRLHVLPMVQYKEFAEYLTWRYLMFSKAMEPILSAREKEELGRSLVYILQSTGQAKEFLVELGAAEFTRYDVQDSLIFRENTIVTKAIEEYMKMVGQTYLLETLGPFIIRLYASEDSHEVDPLRCSPDELSDNRSNLWYSCEVAVQSILQSQKSFPPELLSVFSAWQEKVALRGKPDLGCRLVSACLFLRFLCPAILSPGLFNLSPEHPRPLAARALTLVAKVLQNLANFTRFGEKEEYMAFMNGFLEQHWDAMRVFLQTVANPDSEVSEVSYDGTVDLAYELAVLHSMLCGIFTNVHQQTKDQLEPLPTILNALAEGLPVPESITQDPVYSSRQEERDGPDFVSPRDMRTFRPLVKKSQSLTSLMKERLAPPPRTEEREKRKRHHVTRTQSVPAQRREGRDRRHRSETATVEEVQLDHIEPLQKKKTWFRESSTLPRRKSTVPWCRNEDLPVLGQHSEESISQDQHLVEIRGQIEENQDKQKELEGQLLALSEQMQAVLAQLEMVEETHKKLQRDMAKQLCQMQTRIEALEDKKNQEAAERNKSVVALPLLSLPNLLASFREFGTISNLKLITDKSEALHLPPLGDPPAHLYTQYRFKWCDSKLKYLGIWLPKDPSQLYHHNYLPLLQSLQLHNDRHPPVCMELPPHPHEKNTLELPKLMGGTGLPSIETYYRATHLHRITDWHVQQPLKQWVTLELEQTDRTIPSRLWLHTATCYHLTDKNILPIPAGTWASAQAPNQLQTPVRTQNSHPQGYLDRIHHTPEPDQWGSGDPI
ncbi:RAS activator like-3 [Pelobates cultripes]|uniref:RAS activator like-3 n=1 Tax=Pelobates cultripes TaxID=61616 RepID=A0AAD1VXG5_PELCU|nr:RAS activator like-3 [Pelobates cultripes]